MTTRTDTTFSVRPDRRLIRPTSHSQRFVLARIAAPRATTERERPPVNLAIVLDRSGSMSGEKIRVAKVAVEEAIARLRPDDRFSVVAYDDVVDVVIESTPASAEARRGAIERLRAVDARGSTNLGEGWLRGCEQVARHLVDRGVNRCLLLTDGLANVGMTDPDQLASHAAELRARGVSTSTFGVGNDFDERLLQALADAGGGHFYYIADAPQIRDAITSEVGETLEVVARNVDLEITARDDIRIEPISPYPVQSRRQPDARRARRPRLGTGRRGRPAPVVPVRRDRPRDRRHRGPDRSRRDLRTRWGRRDRAPAIDLELRRRSRQRRPAARRRGRSCGRPPVRGPCPAGGGPAQPQRRLRGRPAHPRRHRRRIRGYAGHDRVLRDLIDELGEEQVDLRRTGGRAAASSEAHFASANALRSRDATGRSVKRG